ncbi:MAG: hypothetical protein J4F36_13200 [Nitrosopumilaceae archaeon]|nr:hypothetical protein [Nitrosopumilaceae archaeon]
MKFCKPSTRFVPGVGEITADNPYYDNKSTEPQILWSTPNFEKDLTKEEIKRNIQYVINLQKRKRIPLFIVDSIETILLNTFYIKKQMAILDIKKRKNPLEYYHIEDPQTKREKQLKLRRLQEEIDNIPQLLDEIYQRRVKKSNN